MENETKELQNSAPEGSPVDVPRKTWPWIIAGLCAALVYVAKDNVELRNEAFKRADREIQKSDKNAENAQAAAQISLQLVHATERLKIYADSVSDALANRAEQSTKNERR